MRIAIGSDHAGFEYKQMLITVLRARGHEVTDFGTDSPESVDYPKYIRPVALAVASGECERGIVLGGSGNGEAIVANRVKGIRCALCWNVESAQARPAAQRRERDLDRRADGVARGGRGDRRYVADDALRGRPPRPANPDDRRG